MINRRYKFQCDFGINEVLSLVDALQYAAKNAESSYDRPQKQTVRKLEREGKRIWKEYSGLLDARFEARKRGKQCPQTK